MTTKTDEKLVKTRVLQDHELTEEQRRIVWSWTRHRVVEGQAYAGTGKTSVLVAYQDRLMRPRSELGAGAKAEHFLALASTNATVDRLKEKLAGGTVVKTLHALALSVTSTTGGRLKVLTEAQELKLLKTAVAEEWAALPNGTLKQDLAVALANKEDLRFLRMFLGLVSASGTSARQIVEEPGSAFRVLRPYLRFIKGVKRRMRAVKAEQQVQTFGDMIRPAVKALRTGHALPYRHLLVDEYQDLTADQAQLVRALAPAMKTVLVVGDRYQTIYGFAGATFTPLKDILPGARRMQLTQTQRFKGRLADLATCVVRQGNPKAAALVGLEGRGERPVLVTLNRADDQAPEAVAWIKDLLAKGDPPGQIMVLGRTKAQAADVERALLTASIPTHAHFRSPFAGNDGLALRLMDRLQRMWRQMEDRSAEALGKHALTSDLRALMDDVCPAPTMKPKAVGECVGKLKRAMQAKMLESQLRLCGDVVLKRLGGKVKLGPDGEEEIRRWEPVARSMTSLSKLRQHIRGLKASGHVHASTVHRAKGGEWDYVILLNVVEGGFPHHRALTARQIEHERNLFYVAVTRARKGLCVFEAPCVQPNVKEPFEKRSQFLSDRATRACFARRAASTSISID